METPKFVNLLNGSDNENSEFATKKWYVIDSDSIGYYSKDHPIKFLTSSLELRLCGYSDAYILVTRNINVRRTIAAAASRGNPQRKQPLAEATQLVFKNWAPFKECSTETNGTLVDEAGFINITIPMYNLTEYSDNYSTNFRKFMGF